MKVLIDIGHPAHVHLFKHFAWDMMKHGHVIFFTCREKEFEIYLLSKYGFKYKSFGKKYNKTIGKIWGMVEFGIKEFITGLEFKPDVLLSHGSIYAAHAAFLLRKPHISLEDTFNFEQMRLYKPFTDVILTADYDHPLKEDRKVISYTGNHELTYLHEKRFKADESIKNILGVSASERYVLLRFVSWKASHDIGLSGFTDANKMKAVSAFSKYAKVFISAEKDLPEELEPYKIKIPPERMHDAMAHASLFMGEGATMASESAVLGTPAIYLNDNWFGYTDDAQKHGLLFSYKSIPKDQTDAITKGCELLANPDTQQIMAENRKHFLADKIDVTAFMVWFIENYPQSRQIMRENPDYQNRFK